jgi:hypothetical protein
MQCKDIAQVIEQEGFSPLPEEARGHIAGCSNCSALIADFERIVAAAIEIPAEVEPPARIWVALRAQLQAEKIIREPKITVPVDPASWWQGFGQMIRGRMLATAAVALLVAAAGYYESQVLRFAGGQGSRRGRGAAGYGIIRLHRNQAGSGGIEPWTHASRQPVKRFAC